MTSVVEVILSDFSQSRAPHALGAQKKDGKRMSLRLNQLHEFSKGDPLFAVVNAPDGSTLAVGLGRELSVLSYTAPGGWPAKHVISNNADERLLSYRFLGHFSEIPASYAVPLEEAISATVEFFKTGGKLSNQLNWEDD